MDPRPIDANLFVQALKNKCLGTGVFDDVIEAFIDISNEIPTMRCENCKHCLITADDSKPTLYECTHLDYESIDVVKPEELCEKWRLRV